MRTLHLTRQVYVGRPQSYTNVMWVSHNKPLKRGRCALRVAVYTVTLIGLHS